jgi:hypothetical protein
MAWTVSGRVVTARDMSPIAGATLTFGDAPPVTTDGAGAFTIVTTDASTRPLVISAPGFLTRETSLTGGEVRAAVEFDLIPPDPDFPLQQYLDIVRNGFERPEALEPSRRWTTNPNVYVWTTFKDTGAAVNPAFVAFLEAELRRLIPAWTANRLQLGELQSGPAERPRQQGWINVQFQRGNGNWSMLGADPGSVSFGSDALCQSLAVAHEFGHALGYWHTRVKPSIMGGGPGSCNPANLSPSEMQIARVMYGRNAGNLAPDKDGPPPPPPVYVHPTLFSSPDAGSLLIACDRLLPPAR